MACSLVMKDERRSERIVVAGPNTSSTLEMPSCVPLFGSSNPVCYVTCHRARSHVQTEPDGHTPSAVNFCRPYARPCLSNPHPRRSRRHSLPCNNSSYKRRHPHRSRAKWPSSSSVFLFSAQICVSVLIPRIGATARTTTRLPACATTAPK